MIKPTLITLVILLSGKIVAQDLKSLEERALKIYTYYAQQQYDSVINYMHPSNFRTISKKDHVKKMRDTYSDQLTVSPVHTPPNFYFREIKKVGENYYCIFYYDQTMKAKFHEEVSKEKSDYLIEYSKKRLGADRVVFNEKMNAILFLKRTKEVAVADKENNYIWTFEFTVDDRAVREQLGL